MPLVFRLPAAAVYWPVHLWAFWPEMKLARRGWVEPSNEDAGSLTRILAATSLGYVLAVALAGLPWGRATAARALLGCGLAGIVGASLLRRFCMRSLGEEFRAAVRTRTGQSLVEHGLYRRVRHPSYTAAILLLGSVGLALGSWLSAATMLGVACVVYRHRQRVEERALLARFGERYRRYMRRTWAFVPFLF